jgi:hypothetical protein
MEAACVLLLCFGKVQARMKNMLRLCGYGAFAISCCILFASLAPVLGQSSRGFSEVQFDGTFLHLGQHILDPSDIGVILQETNGNFQNLSKANETDLSWDSDGVRYTAEAKKLKITWVLDPSFLHEMNGHPTDVFNGKLSIFEIDLARNKPIPEASLSKYGFEATGDQAPIHYQLAKNGWKINIITDRDRNPEGVTLEHSLNPD